MANITFTEGSGLNDPVFGKINAPIRSFLEERAEDFEKKSFIPDLFLEEKSTHWAEAYSSMTAMDGFKAVGENGETPTDGFQASYTKQIENITWKDSFSISREAMEDSKTFDMRKQPREFITGYYRTRERFAFQLFGEAIKGNTSFKTGNVTVPVTCADGLSLFNTAHKAKVKGANQSNKFSDAFSADALAAAETALQNVRGDNGEILAVVPDTILIPNDTKLKKDVWAVVGADKDPATANNGFNYLFGRWHVIVSQYLTDFITPGTSPWILMSSSYNKDVGGAIFQDRTPLDVDAYIDQNTHAKIWTGYARFAAGFNDWRFACVGGVTGGTTLIS